MNNVVQLTMTPEAKAECEAAIAEVNDLFDRAKERATRCIKLQYTAGYTRGKQVMNDQWERGHGK